MPVTFQVVGNLADFGNEPRAGVKVRATASPGIKVGDEAVHSNQPETVVTDEDGAFTLELVSLPGVWYRIQTPYGGALPTINLAGYVPDVDDPTTGTVFPEGTVIDVKDVASESPTPGYEAVLMGPVGPQGATGPKGDKGDTGPAGTTDYNALTNKPTLGTAAATDATDYATAAQGTKADTAVQPATIQSQTGAGAFTTGNVVKVGQYAVNQRYALTADVGTSLVAGGAPNYENVVGGNLANVNTATSNLTGAAALTGQDGNWAFILSGYDNVVNGWATVVNGFHHKVGAGANHGTVSGGSTNVVNASVAYATIGGGTTNTVTGNNGVIAGGSNNTAGAQGTVAGGNINAATGSNSSIGGGNNNTAGGNNSAVAGGTNNTASGTSGAIPGGQFNTASGTASAAMGRENTAAAPASTALGRDVSIPTNLDHAIGHGAGKFTTAGDAQVLHLVAKRQTTDATPAALRLDAAGTTIPLTVPADTTWAFTAVVAARNVNAEESAAYEVKGCVRRTSASASTTALVGTPTVTVLAESAAAWDLAVTASTSLGALELTVTGAAATTIRWVAYVTIVSVTG